MQDFVITGVGTTLLTYLMFIASSLYIEKDAFGGLWQKRFALLSLAAGAVALVVPLFLENGFSSTKVQVAALAVVLAALIGNRYARPLPLGDEPTFIEAKRSFHASWAGVIANALTFGFLLNTPAWTDDKLTLTSTPPKSESKAYLIIFAVTLLMSVGIIVWLNRKTFRKLPSAIQLKQQLNRWFAVPALVGLMIASLQYYTRNISFTNRYYEVILFSIMALGLLWNLVFTLPGIRKRITSERLEHEQIIARQKKAKRKHKRK